VATLANLVAALRRTLADGRATRIADLQFDRSDVAWLFLIILAGLAAVGIVLRALPLRRSNRGRIVLPALPAWVRRSRWALIRHGALALALLAVPFFALALADPRTPFTRQETSFPGRRISLMIDASSSMLSSLPSQRLAKGAPNDAAFFTTVGAARYFVELRMKGEYRDLMSLIEFGDDAYVITPFTTDYENILLSISLIGDWNEFMAFPDQGTMIARAIDQGVGLYQAFDFLEAAGNLMIIFTDGMDAEVLEDGRTALDVLREARRAEIPVYFIRVGDPSRTDPRVSDSAWRAAVERTGGRFYSAADEATIVRAMGEIDKAAAGRIEMRQYNTRTARFAPFALAAAALWTLALALRLGTPWFSKFP
jgi:Ca-activated chloride channel homolog